GTFLGVLLNFHTQDAAIVLLLSALLVAMTCMVVRAAWGQYAEEQEAAQGQAGALLSGVPGGLGTSAVARNPQDDDGVAGALVPCEDTAARPRNAFSLAPPSFNPLTQSTPETISGIRSE
ncbi:unnamed protein product, partial [Prorocentrum cordatum]